MSGRYLSVPGNETEDKRQRGETDIMNFSKRMERFGTSIFSVLLEKKREKMTSGVGMFITQGIFELFEVLLSYFSNTLSFIRVGAFAVSHAAMMEVVLMLAGAEAGSPNWAVIVGGNLFVCGMEGLIVGIQVLRLEYYELFSRFYRGSGREFKPYGQTAKES